MYFWVGCYCSTLLSIVFFGSHLHSQLIKYEFRDEYYDIAWLETGTWYLLQLFNTLTILIIYFPSKLKNILTFNQEVRTEHPNVSVELEERDNRVVYEDTASKDKPYFA